MGVSFHIGVQFCIYNWESMLSAIKMQNNTNPILGSWSAWFFCCFAWDHDYPVTCVWSCHPSNCAVIQDHLLNNVKKIKLILVLWLNFKNICLGRELSAPYQWGDNSCFLLCILPGSELPDCTKPISLIYGWLLIYGNK